MTFEAIFFSGSSFAPEDMPGIIVDISKKRIPIMPDTSKDLFRFLLHSPIDDIFRQIITGISISAIFAKTP